MNRKIFFDGYRQELDKEKKLTQDEVVALDSFLDSYECQKDYFTIDQWAYVFATVFHETAHTFEPVREAYWLSDSWRQRNLRYWPFYGRGFVQLTWLFNYERYSKITGKDLVNNPDLVMEPKLSFEILVHGMKHGVFTGRPLDRYVNDERVRYDLARYVINGRDKRNLIASYAKIFRKILIKSI